MNENSSDQSKFVGVIATVAAIYTRDTSGGAQQEDTRPLPRSIELVGAPVDMTTRSRNYLLSLPPRGTAQLARLLTVAIDAGTLPATRIRFVVADDPEEGTNELVAEVDVDLDAKTAMDRWEQLSDRLSVEQAALDENSRNMMQRGFSLELHWLQ